MEYKIALILITALIASGCSSGPTPQERLKTLADKEDNSSYQVEYKLERPGTSLVRGGLNNYTFYKHGDETMFKASTSIIGGSSDIMIYSYREGQSITCTSKSDANGTDTNCEIANSTTSRYTNVSRYAVKAENLSMAYLGDKEYAGRECSMFGIGIPAKEFKASGDIDGGANVKMCLDKEKGYVAYTSLNLTDPVNALGQQIRTLYTLTATGYSSETSVEDVTPEEGLALNAFCKPLRAQVTSLGYSGNVTLSANGNKTEFSIEKSGSRHLELNNSQIQGENNLKAFYGNETSEASCTVTQN